ncbi:ATP-binding protein, partial [Candidatus Bathyarchaeota archaeon]|nr:ATP-binding protein [Candidatus Bathyarchaeota archaeon]
MTLPTKRANPSRTDYLAESGEFRRHLSSQAPGTGLWLCETDEYRRWHDPPDHGSVWIKGVPGAGKSVMAASLIQHLRTTEECPVLFFFFRNIVAANFSPRKLIQDWLAQLLPHSPKLQFALQARLKTSLAETSDNDLIQLFLDGTSCVPKLYCVGDALDEMSSENRPFLDKLNSLATHRPRSLKLLMTSRPEQYLQSALRDSSIVHISLQQRRVDADIISYLGHRLEMAPQSEGVREMSKYIIDMVARRSEGLFLYALSLI